MSTRNTYGPAATPAPLARKRAALMVSAAAIALIALPGSVAFAQTAGTPGTLVLPQDPTVVAGGAGFNTSGANLNVSQSTDRVVIDWRSFDIGSDAAVNFYQPGTTSIAVNRVSGGGMPSQINGALTANGVVVILNPNGVLFSASSRVDVGGLVASTGQMNVDRFMAGDQRLEFTGATSGAIVTAGQINIAGAGLGAFVAPSVRNDGVINARLGRVALAAGETFTLDLAGDRLIELGLGANTPLVENYGSILADGGRVQLSALAAGVVVDQVINAGGHISVSSAHQDGGTIVLEGDSVTVSGTLDASGATGGGDIRALADHLTVTADARLTAAATVAGDGGFIETSGYQTVNIADGATVNAAGAGGAAGTWLIDPLNLTITSGANNGTVTGSTVTAGTIEATLGAGTNVSLTTNQAGADAGDLTVAGSVNATATGGASLILTGRHILATGGSTISINGGDLTMNVNAVNTLADTTASGNWIQDALNVIGTVSGNIGINLGAGIYRAGAIISHDRVTLDGQGVARIDASHNGDDGITVTSDYVTVQNLEIFGDADENFITFAWPTVTRGVVLKNGADNATVTGNNIHDVRNGVLVDGRNTGSAVTNNTIENTKGAISVQYTDGSNIILTGNSEGVFGNEWGINVHLNGILQTNGTITPSAGALGANTTLAEQARLLAMSTANNGMSIQNQAWSAANRTHAYVSTTGGASNQGSARSTINTVQGGVNAVVTGGTVYVADGTYVENVNITRSGLSLLSANGRDATTIQGVSGVGALGTIRLSSGADNVTLGSADHGFTIIGIDNGSPGIENAAVYLQGNHAGTTIAGNRITANGDHGLMSEYGATVSNTTIDGNIFNGSTFTGAAPATGNQFTVPNVSRQLVVMGGGNGGGNTSAVTFTNNSITGNSGLNTAVTLDVQGATISGNSFATTTGGYGSVLRARGTGTVISGNSFDLANVATSANTLYVRDSIFGAGQADFATLIGANTFDGGGVYTSSGQSGFQTLFRSVHAGVAAAAAGDTVYALDGIYNWGSTALLIDKALTLVGQSQTGTIFDGRGVGSGLGTLQVQADNVTLSNFTLYGADSGANNYGIKVQPIASGYNVNQRLLNFAISDVTVRGSTRAELDLNGVVGATITNFTADGRRVTDDNYLSGGAGVQITDSSNITLSGVHTLGNAWGGVALYQTNRAGAYNGQTTNINIDAAQNQFDEGLGLFTQLESTTQTFGQLNLAGFNYAVRNTGHRADGSQFTFFRTTLGDATAFALALGAPTTGSIEGYTGTDFSNVFTVVDGLAIGSAIRDARSGATVNVGAGTFNEALTIDRSLTLTGAGIDDTLITGGIQISGTLADLRLSDFGVEGSANGSAVIYNSGSITGLYVDGVRIDGLGVAGRHGFIGGQIGGDISITNSEFLNIRGWAAFDTRSGAGGANDGTQITSAVFSGNTLDNTAGHIAFRQQTGAGPYPDITIANNTVTNVGDSTLSFGAIFKAFRAGTVDFTGNNISGIGISSWTPTGEATYGAALMTRDVNTLNVTGNTFTDNNQVFAVEPGRALPTVTNFSGNTFTNNAYSIYLPGDVTGGGTINFGAGNNFVAGANTVQHIVWRSAAGLDLTNVAFNGVLGSAMDMSTLLATEDLITHGTDIAGAGLALVKTDNVYVTTASGSIQRGVNAAGIGFTVNVGSGTFTLPSTLTVSKAIALIGAGRDATVINAAASGYGISVSAGGVQLANFTLNGPSANSGSSYGIKVSPGGGRTAVLDGFTINNVTVRGSGRAELDLNGVRNAVIDGFIADGQGTAGAGIQITDSDGVVIRNSTTSDNAWGGVALYLSNRYYDQQLANITIEASNDFQEANSLFFQGESTLYNAPGTLTIEGYSHIVQNDQFRAAEGDWIYFQRTLQGAIDFALGLDATDATTAASWIQGWNGTAGNTDFYVGLNPGGEAMSLQTAFDRSATGNAIHIASGTYGQSATLGGARVLDLGDVTVNSLTLTAGAAGSTLGGNLTAAGSGLTFSDGLILSRDTGLSGGDITLGSVSGAHALTLNGNTVALGAANLASLTANGATIGTAGVTTTGAQGYTGATTLNGAYTGTGFTVAGATTLGGATTVGGSTITLGSVSGAHSLGLTGTGAVALGAANLASLTANGATINTAGVTTTGAQSYTGATTLNGAYTGTGFTIAGATTLGGNTTVGGSTITLGSVSGAHSLGLTGTGAVALGAANLASLTANGATIGTAGVTTTGAQSYTGATTLNGAYTGTGFTVAGATTLGGATTVGGSTITLGSVSGAHSLGLTGTGAVALGAANLASLTANGATINTAGVTTTGAQSYTGATTLNGAYTGTGFTIAGATTLGGATTVGGSSITLGSVSGAHSLGLTGTGAVALGAANLASLTANGATIGTAGVTTTGAQSYTGATTLNGAYTGTGFTVAGATTLGGATTIGGSSITLGSVSGAHSLGLTGTGAVALGAANLASLTANGATINTAGVTTTGAQSYTGATTLNGAYTGTGFTIAGATTLGGNTTVGGSSITLGSVSGAHSLGLTGTGAVALGAANLASLTANGATINTAGVTTTGAQSYTGATTLNGAYTGTGFTIAGATTLGGATNVTGTAVTTGTIDGPQALTINGGAGAVSVGAIGSTTALASANVSGGSLNIAGARTTGAQTYTAAAITASGQYATTGGAYTLAGSTTLAGATTISTQGGTIATGDVNGTAAGAQSLSLDAGTGSTSLGALGSNVRLGAVLVRANTTVLNGATYAGNSLAFQGTGANANVRLTRALTTFNSTTGASAGTISINPNLIGTAAGAQSVAFIAGPGTGADSANGDITLGNLGSDAIRLGSMSVTGSDLTAQTVKLAGNYASVLTGNQTFSAQTLDTLGNANMRVGGNDTGPIVAGGSVTIVSGGSTTGSLTAAGPVSVTSTGNTNRAITSGGSTTVASQGTIGGSVASSGPVVLTATGPIVSSVTTPGAVSITSTGTVTVNVQAGSVNLTAPGGTIGGTFGTISTGAAGTFNINGEVVVGDGIAADRQILVDSFLAPAGGVVGSTGQIQLPVNFALALIAPAGNGSGTARQPIIVNSIDRLGELLRLGYTAIIIQIDGNEEYEQELNLAAEDTQQPQA